MGERIEAQKGEIIPRIWRTTLCSSCRSASRATCPRPCATPPSATCCRASSSSCSARYARRLAAQQITADQFKEDVKAQAADTVKQNLALDAYARHNNIVVTDEEVVDEFKNSGAKDTDKLYAEWKKQGRLSFVREGLLRGKALEALLKEAEIEEVELPRLTRGREEACQEGRR